MLLGVDTYLRQQQIQINQQAETFFSQVPLHTNNSSAERIDRLSAQLGLSPNVSYTHPVPLNQEAAIAFHNIEASLNRFLGSQTNKTFGPLDQPPAELQTYLQSAKPVLHAIQAHLLTNEAPQWEMNSDRMADPDYSPPGFFNIRSLQKILLLWAIDTYRQGNRDEAFSVLEASWQLNKTIANRSDLSSQVLVAVISVQRASLLRHMTQVPTQWQDRLQRQTKTQPVMKGVQFETWLRYRIAQNAWIPQTVPAPEAGLLRRLQATFANRFSAQSYFKLISLDNTKTAHLALEKLAKINVCTTPQVAAEKQLAQIQTALWNKNKGGAPDVVAKRWQTAGTRSLALELSVRILQLKERYETANTWPTQLDPIPSYICPGEHWHYTRQQDGSISLSFSHRLLSPTAIPLYYQIQKQPSNTKFSEIQPTDP